MKLYRQIENTDYYVAEDGTVMIRKGRYVTKLVPSGSKLVKPEDASMSQCCSSCRSFLHEDIDGGGWCKKKGEPCLCGDYCGEWKMISAKEHRGGLGG